MSKRIKCLLAVMFVVALSSGAYLTVQASDHDDGEYDNKGRNLGLTDLYVFKETWQNSSGNANNLIFIMNTNPRSVARQQYSFSTTARYEFHVSRVANKKLRPTGSDDVTLRFTFSEPDSANKQAITFETYKDGFTTTTTATDAGQPIVTSPLALSYTATLNDVTVGSSAMKIFAGLREDPFFFDVERFFRIRAELAETGPSAYPFQTPSTAVDFAKGFNVNAIVVSVPIAYLQSSALEKTFDVWETISVPR